MTRTLYDYLEDKYPYHTPADARFKSEDTEPASFALDVSDPRWKFLFGNPDGPPISGTLFYNDNVFDGDNPILSVYNPTKAKFYVDQKREDGTLFVHVQFYAPDSNTDLLGEFLAQDSQNISASSGLLHERKEGEWQFLTDDTLYDRLKKKYHGRKVDGIALFPGNASFEFNTDELGWQFVHADPSYGPGLDGTLFYNDNVFDGPNPILSKEHPTQADFYVRSVTDKGTLYVLVHFHVPGPQNGDQFLGEFLAKDPNDEARTSGLLNKVEDGKWSFVGTDSLYDQLSKKYGNADVADAFFLKDDSTSSFLFEVLRLHREFYDGRAVGERVTGVIFHNDGGLVGSNPKVVPHEKVNANYYIIQVKEKEVLYVHILFFEPGSSQTKYPLFEFLARDPHDTAGSSASLYQIKTGTWDTVSYTSTDGTVFKEKNSTRISLDFADGTTGRIDCKTGDKIYKESFDTSGLLNYKRAPGKYAKWYQDRFVLYETINAHDFTGFFYVTDDKTIYSQDGATFEVTWSQSE